MPPVPHRKVKPAPTKTEADIGQTILDYWESNPRWTRQQLLDKLAPLLDVAGGDKRNIVFDVIIDADIDATSRMVWISTPTPDITINGTGPQTWQAYSTKFKTDEGTTAAEKLGSA